MTQTKVPYVKKSLLRDERKIENGCIAKYEAVPVYVERKKYSESDVAGVNAVTISRRVESLTTLLNVRKASSFRSLHCIGSFQDPYKSEYGFVFDRPLASREHVAPRSLLSLLGSTYAPSQTARFQLAYELATTVLHLHSAGWLHKGLRSENILFFPPSDSAPFTLTKPYVMGFKYARRDAPDEESEKRSLNPSQDIYRHPRAQGPVSDRYVKAFDVYALGIILVEIARWKPFKDIVERMGYNLRNVNAEVTANIQKTITGEKNMDKFPVNLRFAMGDEYTEVVLCCLGSYFEDEKLIEKEYIEEFYDMIVRRLKACKV